MASLSDFLKYLDFAAQKFVGGVGVYCLALEVF